MNTLEINQQKVIETKVFLKEITGDPVPFKDDLSLKSALKSQGGLAKYSNSERGIASCSLNTLKSASESLLERGFLELDELRVNAKDAIESVFVGKKATKTTRTGLKHKVVDLEHELCTMQKSNFLLTTIISELRGGLKKMALSTESREFQESEYRRINQEVEIKLNYTFKELNVKR
ncbi:hypothetical protein A9Q81_07755 [Gammaproteobacteria bacterium 42_54_T18]|nr:hypothetical protein A9Q81_07755 [Gammaproteobacteria bacterium 42_54_T18]